MLGTFVITLRETLEAALIVGILLSYLVQIGHRSQVRYIYWGVGLAVAASLAFAAASKGIADLFQEHGEEYFEAGILLVAVVVLTHMVVWMHHHAREIKGKLQHEAGEAIAHSHLFALGTMAFVGVFREGIETVLFLWGLFLQSQEALGVQGPLLGGFLGVGLGVLLAYLFFQGFRSLDLKQFFRVTGLILILMAAGMLSSGIGKLISAEVLPGFVEPIWNTAWILDEKGLVGSFVKGIFGYRSSPALIQVLFYFAYFPFVWLMLRVQKHDLAQ